jgi:hypothetical protein
MVERKRFQFSVWNLMLMMVPLAVVFAVWSVVARNQSGKGALALTTLVGVGGAIGALVGGWKGMRKGLLLGLGLFIVAASVEVVILLVIAAVRAIGS